MKIKTAILISATLISFVQTCEFARMNRGEVSQRGALSSNDSSAAFRPTTDSLVSDSTKKLHLPEGSINTKNIQPQQVVDFAKTLLGTPYKYASIDPSKGFDCSGFVTYVFTHFNIIVPRSSIDFTNVGQQENAQNSKPGDLILFTGTDSTERFVGHMGIIISNNNNDLQFIHSSSGKAHGVTVSPLAGYYQTRFVKVIRIFPQNF